MRNDINNLLEKFYKNSYLFGANAPFIEELYSSYLKDPAAISHDWRAIFDTLQSDNEQEIDVDHQALIDTLVTRAKAPSAPQTATVDPTVCDAAIGRERKQIAILQLINAYRFRGHEQANLDPLRLREKEPTHELDAQYHQLTQADLNATFYGGSLAGPEQMPLKDIIALLKDTYCGTMGIEYMHITDTQQKRWLQERLEKKRCRFDVDAPKRMQILERLIAAEGLEKYLHKKYVGQKRFSLEGSESLIPLLDELIQRAGSAHVQEVVLGMAHRGRLNVLVNILGKSPKLLFQEFEGAFDSTTRQGSGDVKYHLGFSSDVETEGGSLHLALAFNPSHLEIISPVVEGSVRARQHRRDDRTGEKVLPVVIHGDAAFAGQGVVMETFNMSQARGYTTGGTVHIIINNQIGFTTSNPMDTRSTPYCTEVARMVQAPILHVNGDDPEAVVCATQIALDYRMTFHRDVVIDLVCYRRHGHNEADDPSVTQPMMYKVIKKHPTTVKLYSERLVQEGVITQNDVDAIANQYRQDLDAGKNVARTSVQKQPNPYTVDWSPFLNSDNQSSVITKIDNDTIQGLSEKLHYPPSGFKLHNRVEKIVHDRIDMVAGKKRIDWGFAETMAYASLLNDGFSVRVSGQDAGRGTFFHRHAVLHDQNTGDSYVPLQHITGSKAHFVVIDSLLSEEAVLGFEYGYSTADPNTLVIWEAQFGDFANGAQVVVDQFISSGEAKWGRLCGLVMFLPHGYDGQGPEHSSARLERYLHLCAEDNMQVCVPSLPSQMFHLIRRQILRPVRKPLIIMTPKSLLRHKESSSELEDLTHKTFERVIGESDDLNPEDVRRVVVCSGKIYFELREARRQQQRTDVAIIRLEQLYPYPEEEIQQQMQRYSRATDVIWCQEEPRNQGAWHYIRRRLRDCLLRSQTLGYASRLPSASPAAGYYALHLEQQKQVISDALG